MVLLQEIRALETSITGETLNVKADGLFCRGTTKNKAYLHDNATNTA